MGEGKEPDVAVHLLGGPSGPREGWQAVFEHVVLAYKEGRFLVHARDVGRIQVLAVDRNVAFRPGSSGGDGRGVRAGRRGRGVGLVHDVDIDGDCSPLLEGACGPCGHDSGFCRCRSRVSAGDGCGGGANVPENLFFG